MSEQCEICRYWLEIAERLGRCRRFPPVARPATVADYMSGDEGTLKIHVWKAVTAWPVVHETAWCGEFASKPSIMEQTDE